MTSATACCKQCNGHVLSDFCLFSCAVYGINSLTYLRALEKWFGRNHCHWRAQNKLPHTKVEEYETVDHWGQTTSHQRHVQKDGWIGVERPASLHALLLCLWVFCSFASEPGIRCPQELEVLSEAFISESNTVLISYADLSAKCDQTRQQFSSKQ